MVAAIAIPVLVFCASIVRTHEGRTKSGKAKFERLIRSPMTQFPNAGERLDVPHLQGVYIIYDPKGRVAHVGRTVRGKRGLHQRLNNHLQGASSFVQKELAEGSALRGGYKYRFIAIEDNRLRAFLEAFTIGQLCPDHIGGGALLSE
ncbi:hypothetical protein AB7M49_001584 [Bradyrhizobium elkanii]